MTDTLEPPVGRIFNRVSSQALQENDTFSEESGRFEEFEESDWLEELDELETWDWDNVPDAAPLAEPSPRRWALTFAVIATLLIFFSVVAFWGLIGSDWWYGTYGEIGQVQWDKIADLRDRLVQLDLAPEAVKALDDALLLPHPTTEQVLFDLKIAAQALDPLIANANARQIQGELHDLINAIEPDAGPIFTPRPTSTPWPGPTLTPIIDAPVAQG